MKPKPTSLDAYRLMHDGALALAEVEANGMRIDVDRMDRTIQKVGRRIEKLAEEMTGDDVWKVWKRRYGAKSNLGSRAQLGQILYGELGYKPVGKTRLGKRASVTEDDLSRIDLPFVKTYLEIEKLKKLRSTYLEGIRREAVDGLLHPSFNLHLVRTYRSSSDSPNFQNIPVRDKVVGKLIRSCFVPRDGHVLVEIDYSALEVRISSCYNKDPVLIEYIEDKTKDMHRDMAGQCFMLPADQVTKEIRFTAKGQFVFAEFYGSYYAQTALGLWNDISKMKLKTVDGVSLKEHLAAKGIKRLGEPDNPKRGTFMQHIQQVEQDFWGRRFKVYDRWKKDWWERYRRRGWFPLLTGFRVEGAHKRNDVINYPVQGAAFHCLLWSLIRLVKWMKRGKMRSVVVGQIHDSIVADVHRDELDEYLATAKRIMTEDVRREWTWICVPLEIEAEVGEVNWFEKRKVEL